MKEVLTEVKNDVEQQSARFTKTWSPLVVSELMICMNLSQRDQLHLFSVCCYTCDIMEKLSFFHTGFQIKQTNYD